MTAAKTVVKGALAPFTFLMIPSPFNWWFRSWRSLPGSCCSLHDLHYLWELERI